MKQAKFYVIPPIAHLQSGFGNDTFYSREAATIVKAYNKQRIVERGWNRNAVRESKAFENYDDAKQYALSNYTLDEQETLKYYEIDKF